MPEKSILLDVSVLFNGAAAELPFAFTISPEDTEKTLDLSFAEDVKVTGRAYEKAHGVGKAESFVELTFTLEGAYDTHCARCTKDLHRPFFLEKTYGLTKHLKDDDDAYIEVPSGVLDVYELCETAFYLELPTKVLCKEDCKGLCTVCGHDLNEGECGCDRSFKRFALKELEKLLDK